MGKLRCLLLIWLVATPAWGLPESLTTQAERSGYQRTGRYQEVPALCQAFSQRWPQWVRWESFGTTPEGRPMIAMVVSKSGVLKPGAAKLRSIPVLLMQGGIHAGEIDGKDAGFWALRDLLERPGSPLDKMVIVFVPVFNVDGHERWGAYNRPNQNGPEEMGWRVTSQNLNLNRDYAKADTPEMLAMLDLLRTWDPILYVDLHVTDGSQFQPDVALLVEPKYVGDNRLAVLARTMQLELANRLKGQGSMPLDFYPSLRDPLDPASGFSDGAYTPRFSTGYWPLHNRIGMLVEAHSWKNYATRVKVAYSTIIGLADLTARDGPVWLGAAAQADRLSSELAGQPVTLSFKTIEESPSTLDFPGYAYKKVKSPVSGAKALVYDPTTPQVWKVPFYGKVVPDVVVEAPLAGYLIPTNHAEWLGKKLKAHGIRYSRLESGLSDRPLEVFRADKVTFSAKPSEGHQTARLSGHWSVEDQEMLPGSLFVPIAQPEARLIMALLEPQAPDSYANWGFFNAYFEQKEYMEEYVAEGVGKQMLAEQPALRAEFEKRLRTDPKFAKDPAARLDFFYRHHPSYDIRMNLYPVMRTNEKPPSPSSSNRLTAPPNGNR